MTGENQKKSVRQRVYKDVFRPTEDDKDHTAAWWLFFAPGKLFLWISYMFPASVISAIAAGRQISSPTVQILFSIIFWILLIALLISLFESTVGIIRPG